MQKLGYLASVLLLASVIIGPIGLSHAQTVDTATVAKVKAEKIRAEMDKQREERLQMQLKMASDAKSKMQAMKMQAEKDIEAKIVERNQAIKKNDLPTAADIIAQIKANAKAAIEARAAPGGPGKVQTQLEKDRMAFDEKVKDQKEWLVKSVQKDVKYTKDDKRLRDKTLKNYAAIDQLSKETSLKGEYKKAEVEKDTENSKTHHANRK